LAGERLGEGLGEGRRGGSPIVYNSLSFPLPAGVSPFLRESFFMLWIRRGRRERGKGVALLSLWQKDTTFLWRLSKDSLSKDRVPSDLYIKASPIAKVRESRMLWCPSDSQTFDPMSDPFLPF